MSLAAVPPTEALNLTRSNLVTDGTGIHEVVALIGATKRARDNVIELPSDADHVDVHPVRGAVESRPLTLFTDTGDKRLLLQRPRRRQGDVAIPTPALLLAPYLES
jgi:hypothetical protein